VSGRHAPPLDLAALFEHTEKKVNRPPGPIPLPHEAGSGAVFHLATGEEPSFKGLCSFGGFGCDGRDGPNLHGRQSPPRTACPLPGNRPRPHDKSELARRTVSWARPLNGASPQRASGLEFLPSVGVRSPGSEPPITLGADEQVGPFVRQPGPGV
jgi:hypothetical protein